MNKIFKVVWSKVRNSYVVVSETAKANGKSGVKSIATVVAAAVLLSGGTALAAPVTLDSDRTLSHGIFSHTDWSGASGEFDSNKNWDLGSNTLTITGVNGNTVQSWAADYAVYANNYSFVGGEGSKLQISNADGTALEGGGILTNGTIDVDELVINVTDKAFYAAGVTNVTADNISITSTEGEAAFASDGGTLNIKANEAINIKGEVNAVLAGAGAAVYIASGDTPADIVIEGDIGSYNIVDIKLATADSSITGASEVYTDSAQVNLTLDNDSTWNVTGDSSVTSITGTSYEIAGTGEQSLTVNNKTTGNTTAANGIYSTGSATISGLDTLDVTSANRHALEVAMKMEITDVGTVNLTSNNGNGAMVYGDLTIDADALNIDAQNGHGIRAAKQDGHSANVDINVTDLTITATKAGETALKASDGAAVDVAATGTATVVGDIEAQADSSVGLELNGADSSLTGAIKTAEGATTTLTMNDGATWTATGDSKLSVLAGSGANIEVGDGVQVINIVDNQNDDVTLSKDANGQAVSKEDLTNLKEVLTGDVADIKIDATMSNAAIIGEVTLDENDQMTTTIDTDTLAVTGDVVAGEVSLKDTAKQATDNKTAIATNAANIQNNANAIAGLNQNITRLDGRLDKVGAGAAALAALHPLDYDPEDKLSFSAGVGNYAGETAAAVGAFYRPNEDVMFSIGGTAGNGENMVNAGVSFAIGKGSSGAAKLSKAELVQEVNDLKAENKELQEENKDIRNELNKLKAMVMELAAKK